MVDGRTPMVRAQGLVKTYGELTAVDRVDVDVMPGTVCGLLGPNGAGKTTLLRMLLGLVRPDAGEVRVGGVSLQPRPVDALAGVAGFVEAPRFYPYLSGRKNLELLARLDGGTSRERIDDALATVDLSDRAGSKVREYSYGMIQRLGVAAALIREPQLLVLDEPSNGLDPAGIRDMRALVRRLGEEGATILLSSHDMAEVDELCDQVTIMRRGAVAFDGSLPDLRRRAGRAARVLMADDNQRALTVCGTVDGVEHPTLDGTNVRFDADDATVERLTRALVAAGVGLRSVHAPTSALQTLFFRLTEDPEEAA